MTTIGAVSKQPSLTCEKKLQQLASPLEEVITPDTNDVYVQSGFQQKKTTGKISSEMAKNILETKLGITKIWEFKTGGSINSSPCIGPDGTAYVSCNDGKLYAVKDGKKIWEFKTEGPINSSPCIGPDGTVYVGSDDCKLYAIDKNGNKKWEFKTGSSNVAYVRSSPCLGPDGTVYVGSVDGKLYAVKSGKRLWEYATHGAVISSPSIGTDGTVYFGSLDGKLYATKKVNRFGWYIDEANLLSYKNGKKLWDFQAGATSSSPRNSSDGTVYIGSNDGKLYAVKDGKKLWDFKTDGEILSSSPCIGPDGTVYIGSNDGKLYAVKDGKKTWEFKTGGKIQSSPCIGPDETVYFGSDDGVLYAVKDGKKTWEFKTGGPIQSSPLIGADGTVYFNSTGGKLIALKFNTIEEQLEKSKEEESSKDTPSLETFDDWIIIDGLKLKKKETSGTLNFLSVNKHMMVPKKGLNN